MNAKWILIGVAAIVILGIGYYAVSPLFIHIRANDALPQAVQTSATQQVPTEAVIAAPVNGSAGHPASGTARIVQATDKSFLRYENFKTINGPDLYVYLAADLEAKDFINLGTLKATEGNVNYEIPAGVDVKKYHYALVWCKTFSVLFNSADVSH